MRKQCAVTFLVVKIFLNMTLNVCRTYLVFFLVFYYLKTGVGDLPQINRVHLGFLCGN